MPGNRVYLGQRPENQERFSSFSQYTNNQNGGHEMPDVKITFKKASDYKRIAVTGAWGGVSPQGEIIFDLYIESRDLPQSLTMKLEPGKPPEEIQTGEEGFVRESQIGIVVRPDIAHSIGKWLIEKAKEAGVIERSEGHA
jgi:hypothetical protein